MSKTKAKFVVDDSFPLIDGVGHSDKIDWFNVKGGGSSNTTLFDAGYGDLHNWQSSRSSLVIGTNIQDGSAFVDPDIIWKADGVPYATNPWCLNSVLPGDRRYLRGSDRIAMNRIEISGAVTRDAGYYTYVGSPGGLAAFPYHRPKCAIFLVLDRQADHNTFSAESFWSTGGGYNTLATNRHSNVPFVPASWLNVDTYPESRFVVLAYEILDFDEKPDFSLTPRFIAGTETTAPWGATVEEYRSQWAWPSCQKGFRFDVDLNDVLCCFDDAYQYYDHGVSMISDNALHMLAICFDGISENGYTPSDFGTLKINYFSRLWFRDWLAPSIPHAPAGADGDVIPPAEDDLEVLADESAKLAGLPALPDSPIVRERKKVRKGDVGFYNFMSRNDDVLMEFPDDPEVALLPIPGTRGSSKGPARKKGRRFGSHRGNLFPFGSFDPDEPGAGERFYKRGKF